MRQYVLQLSCDSKPLLVGFAAGLVLARPPRLGSPLLPPAQRLGRGSTSSTSSRSSHAAIDNAARTQWEVVADRAPSRGRNAPSAALFSCARAWYGFPSTHAVYSAAILLDAENPARTAPNLPGLTPGAHPGEFEEAASSGGEITAKRVGNAWLFIQGPNQAAELKKRCARA